MKILPVSEFSCRGGKPHFEAKKENETKSVSVPSGMKKAVPTAALILAMMADPVAVNKVEAAPMDNDNIEAQWHPHRPPHHRPPHYHFHPVPPPPPVYYNPYNYVLPTLIMMNYLQNMAALSSVYVNQVSPVSVGNVAFNRQDIKEANVYTDDGVDYHSVVLTNGTNLIYPEQPESNYAAVYRNDNGYMFEGLSDAYIEGSKNRDNYTLNGCRNTSVDVGGDDRIDKVLVQRYRITPANEKQYTYNVSVTASNGDIVNNRKVYGNDETSTYSGY